MRRYASTLHPFPSRALVALAIAAVSLTVALGVASAGTSGPAKQACVKGQALLERTRRTPSRTTRLR